MDPTPPATAAGTPSFPRHVLVAVDGSAASLAAAARAAGLTAASGGRATVLAVIALPPSILDLLPSLGVAEALDATARDMTHEAVAICEAAGVPVEMHDRRLPFGSIGHEIVKMAIEGGCDLIALGSRGRSGLGATLGSVAARVAAEAPCPVLVVPAPSAPRG